MGRRIITGKGRGEITRSITWCLAILLLHFLGVLACLGVFCVFSGCLGKSDDAEHHRDAQETTKCQHAGRFVRGGLVVEYFRFRCNFDDENSKLCALGVAHLFSCDLRQVLHKIVDRSLGSANESTH